MVSMLWKNSMYIAGFFLAYNVFQIFQVLLQLTTSSTSTSTSTSTMTTRSKQQQQIPMLPILPKLPTVPATESVPSLSNDIHFSKVDIEKKKKKKMMMMNSTSSTTLLNTTSSTSTSTSSSNSSSFSKHNLNNINHNNNNNQIRIPKDYNYLLSVPFYIYEDWGIPWIEPPNNKNDTIDLSLVPNHILTEGQQDGERRPLSISSIVQLDPILPIHSSSTQELKSKHADDIYLITAALQHPMRTLNPNEAKLFLIPTPFNILMERIDATIAGIENSDPICMKLNTTTTTTTTTTTNTTNTTTTTYATSTTQSICNVELIKYVNDIWLPNSPYYQKHNGRDHIVIVSHWRWKKLQRQRYGGKGWYPTKIAKTCSQISFEGQLQYKNHTKHKNKNQKNKNQNKNHHHSQLSKLDPIVFPSYYVGRRCPPPPPPLPIPPPQEQQQQQQDDDEGNNSSQGGMVPNNDNNTNNEKIQDFAMIATLYPLGRKKKVIFQDRINICTWITNYNKNIHNNNVTDNNHNNNNNNNHHPIKMKSCGLGLQCPSLRQAKFIFHAIGDTPGSNRLMDTILSHSIPIFTRIEQYTVVPKWINWTKLSYFINLENIEQDDEVQEQQEDTTSSTSTTSNSFINTLHDIVNNQKLYHEKQQNVIQNSDLFDYTTIVPLDTYLYMFQIALYPETKTTRTTSSSSSSPYTALLLP